MGLMVDTSVFVYMERKKSSVEHNLPLLTNNVTEFSRVAELTVIPFKTSSSSEETT
jgi:predicted nucleic acid-binding protein